MNQLTIATAVRSFLRKIPQPFLIIFLCSSVLDWHNSSAAVGFTGGLLAPASQSVCSGGTVNLSFNVSTCTLASGSDWTATYHIDSSYDGGSTWFTPSGTTSGICGAAYPAVTYSATVFVGISCATRYYRVRLTSITSNCFGPFTTYTSFVVEATICPTLSPITGSSLACMGLTSSLSDAIGGGTWTSSSPGVATIGSTGVLTSISPGTTTISYAVSGCSPVSKTVTVKVSPVLTGIGTVCQGNHDTLISSSSSVTWSSSNPSVGTVSTSGVLPGTGVLSTFLPGTISITSTDTNGCYATLPVTVNAVPSAITGTPSLCVGDTQTLHDSPPGGMWSSSSPGVAAIGSTGLITGISMGTTVISYSFPAGCSVATLVLSVNTNPVIAGSSTACTGSHDTLTSSPYAVAWSSSNPSAGTIYTSVAPAQGILAAISPGVTTITSTDVHGCHTTFHVTVNLAPGPITGCSIVCLGGFQYLSYTTSGGSWSSSTPSVATISSGAALSGISVGSTTISYTIPGGCSSVLVATVIASPPIYGSSTVCLGTTAVYSVTPVLSVPGSWSSSNPSIAAIDSAGGTLHAISPGAVTITYKLHTCPPYLCASTFSVTVNPNPTPISGSSTFCVADTQILHDGTPGGTWSSGTTSVATISSTGTATGISPGASVISYTLGSGCFATRATTVQPSPAPIAGALGICQASSDTLSNTTAGGTWQSGSPAIAGIDLSTGIMTGMSGGTAIISYISVFGCYITSVATVTALPATGSITGSNLVCPGDATALSGTPSGGIWSSSNGSIATISAAGMLTGVVAGVATISYIINNDCGTSTATFIVTVVPTYVDPGVISGADSVCSTQSIPLTNTVGSGIWVSSDTSIATVDLSGNVTGISPGSVDIKYICSNYCVSDSATHLVTVVPGYVCGLATNEVQPSATVQVYPNPFHDGITIELPSPAETITMEMIDILGNTVFTSAINGLKSARFTAHPGKLPPGYYLLKLTTPSLIYRKKVTAW